MNAFLFIVCVLIGLVLMFKRYARLYNEKYAEQRITQLLPSVVLRQAQHSDPEACRYNASPPFSLVHARPILNEDEYHLLAKALPKRTLVLVPEADGRLNVFYRVGPYWIALQEMSAVTKRVAQQPELLRLTIREDTPVRVTVKADDIEVSQDLGVGSAFGVRTVYPIHLQGETLLPPSVVRTRHDPEGGIPIPPSSPAASMEEVRAARELGIWLWERAALHARAEPHL